MEPHDGISALTSAMGGHGRTQKECGYLHTGSRSSPGTKSTGTFVLDLAALRTMRNQHLSKAPTLC